MLDDFNYDLVQQMATKITSLADLTKTYVETQKQKFRRPLIQEMAVELADVVSISRQFQYDQPINVSPTSGWVHSHWDAFLEALEESLATEIDDYTRDMEVVIDSGMRNMGIKGFLHYHQELAWFNTQLVANWLLTSKEMSAKYDFINKALRSTSHTNLDHVIAYH